MATEQDNAAASAGLCLIGVWLFGLIGWVTNIVTVFGSGSEMETTEFVLRIVGIFVAVIGVFFGWYDLIW